MQRDTPTPSLEGRSRAILKLMAIVLIVFFIQLWLTTIALGEFLAGRAHLAVPTFLASGACFLANLRVLKRLQAIDSREN
jgi:hypothetical protein